VKGTNLAFRLDSIEIIEKTLSAIGLSLPSSWIESLRWVLIDLSYNVYTQHLYLDSQSSLLSNVKRRLKVILPSAAYQMQTSTLPRSFTWYPLTPCQSSIFSLCAEGDIKAVKLWFENSWASPFVVNQHGENLLHVRNIINS
jgi:hypothetical protein